MGRIAAASIMIGRFAISAGDICYTKAGSPATRANTKICAATNGPTARITAGIGT